MSEQHDWGLLPIVAEPKRDGISRPFPTTVNGEMVTCSTNGHVMVLVRRNLGYEPLEGSPNIANVVLPAEAGVTRHPVEVGELRAFLGIEKKAESCCKCKDTGTIPCYACGGTGEGECTCPHCDDVHDGECEECEGSGEEECACSKRSQHIERISLFGSHFDADVVRPAIRALPDGSAEWRSPEQKERAHAIVGDGWSCLLMPLRTDDGPAREFPAMAASAATTTAPR